MEGYHSSVLLKEVLEALDVKRGNWYLDLNVGDGGHSLEIIGKGGKIVGVDVDPQALERATKRFEEEGIDKGSYILLRGNFRDIESLLSQTDKKTKFAGAIFDLGVSSLQLMSPERGFSFVSNGPLDMRMDPTLEVKALDLINAGGRKELYELFSHLGEEKNARTLADAIVSAREVGRIETTRDLAEIAENTLGRREKIHPATQIFQALRIAVNDELKALEEGLEKVKNLVEKNGTLVVISFHSLEDRIVKLTFRKWEDLESGEILTKKPIVPTEQEVIKNPRSRSAKMRVFKV